MIGGRLPNPVVHALCVSLDRGAGQIARGKLGPLALGGAQEPELQLEAVAVERRLAHDLGEPAFTLPAEEVHLEEPELGVHVAGGEEKVMVRGGHDMRGPI